MSDETQKCLTIWDRQKVRTEFPYQYVTYESYQATIWQAGDLGVGSVDAPLAHR